MPGSSTSEQHEVGSVGLEGAESLAAVVGDFDGEAGLLQGLPREQSEGYIVIDEQHPPVDAGFG